MRLKKHSFALIAVVAVFFFPMVLLGANLEEYCYIDNFGNYWRFIGGKLGKKAFATEMVSAACGVVVGVSTFPKTEDGKLLMTGVIGQDSAGTCVGTEVSAYFYNNMLEGVGVYDNFPRELDPDGLIGFTAIDCSSIPLNADKKAESQPNGKGPGVKSE